MKKKDKKKDKKSKANVKPSFADLGDELPSEEEKVKSSEDEDNKEESSQPAAKSAFAQLGDELPSEEEKKIKIQLRFQKLKRPKTQQLKKEKKK